MLAVFHQSERDPDLFSPQGNIGLSGLHSTVLEPLQIRLETEAPGGSGRIDNQSPILAVAVPGQLAIAGLAVSRVRWDDRLQGSCFRLPG